MTMQPSPWKGDLRRLARRLAAVFVGLLLASAGPAGAQSSTMIRVNKTVMGTGGVIRNVLKTINVVYDPSRDQVYVAGTLTGHVGVVSATKGKMVSTYYVQDDIYDGKRGVWDNTNKVLWHVSSGGEYIYASDPHAAHASTARRLAVLSIKGYLASCAQKLGFTAAAPKHPIRGHVVVPSTGHLWVAVQLAENDATSHRLLAYRLRNTGGGTHVIELVGDWATGSNVDLRWAPSWSNSTASSATGALAALVRDHTANTNKVVFLDVSSGAPVIDHTFPVPLLHPSRGVNHLDMAAGAVHVRAARSSGGSRTTPPPARGAPRSTST